MSSQMPTPPGRLSVLLEAERLRPLAAPAAGHAQPRLQPGEHASLLYQPLSSRRSLCRAVWGGEERREDRSRARSPSQVPEPPRPGPPAAMAVHLSQAHGVRLLPADWAARGGGRRAPGRTDARPARSGGGRRGAGSACPVTDPGCRRLVTHRVPAATPDASVRVAGLASSTFDLQNIFLPENFLSPSDYC